MKRIIALLIILAAMFLFYRYGRSIWRPIVLKIKGEETVNSIIEKYGDKVHKSLLPNLNNIGLETYPEKIALLAFKEEQVLEVLAFKDSGWKKIKEYPFTGTSGKLGPKLKEGDKQIPEGIYSIEFLNPNSSYHLSLKVNYPNEFDKLKGELEGREKLGNDIFIHGNNVTVGCIPIGDKAIEELFILASNSINEGIKVIICPRDFRTNQNFPKIKNIEWEHELYENIHSEIKNYLDN